MQEAEAKAMRKDNAATVFTAGLFIAAFVGIGFFAFWGLRRGRDRSYRLSRSSGGRS